MEGVKSPNIKALQGQYWILVGTLQRKIINTYNYINRDAASRLSIERTESIVWGWNKYHLIYTPESLSGLAVLSWWENSLIWFSIRDLCLNKVLASLVWDLKSSLQNQTGDGIMKASQLFNWQIGYWYPFVCKIRKNSGGTWKPIVGSKEEHPKLWVNSVHRSNMRR